jgi:hypothetical protein
MFISTKKSDITRLNNSNNNEKSQIKTSKNLYQPQIIQPQQQKQKIPSAINPNESNLGGPKRNVLTSNANNNINTKQTAALVEVVVQTRTILSSNQTTTTTNNTTNNNNNIIINNRKSSNANKHVITANNNNANLQQK